MDPSLAFLSCLCGSEHAATRARNRFLTELKILNCLRRAAYAAVNEGSDGGATGFSELPMRR